MNTQTLKSTKKEVLMSISKDPVETVINYPENLSKSIQTLQLLKIEVLLTTCQL